MYIGGPFPLLNKHPFSIRVCQSGNSSFDPRSAIPLTDSYRASMGRLAIPKRCKIHFTHVWRTQPGVGNERCG